MNKLNASFRDPAGFIFTSSQGEILRQINQIGAEEFDLMHSSGLYDTLVKKKFLIPHQEVDNVYADAYKTIKPERLPFISYPYEWSFGQLKDAALLTLYIQKAALKKGMSLKDSSAYNVQFVSGKPVFIDTLSFEVYEEGKPWVAYKQFCQHFLAPIALASMTDIRTLDLLSSNIDGIPLDLASALLPRKSKFKFSLATHIHWHAKTQQKYAGKQTNQKAGKGVSKMAMLGLIDNLVNAVKSLKWNPKGTEWGEYYTFTNYSDSSFDEKKSLVAAYIEEAKPSTVWDLGANDGTFSSIAALKGIETVAFDIDPIAVEKNYRRVKQDNIPMLPLQLDLTNPSTGIGWAHEERDSLEQRGKADVVMALAIIHHIAISNNVPLEKVADYLSRLGNHVIIEFVPKEDSQVKILLATREDIFVSYHIEGFEKAFTQYFDIVKKQQVGDSLRTLYLLKSKR
ncbi:MAG: SAM-dependent methyltransferase [Bacteroidetes bacterium]|jgi:ribosomal protein L11 methylase PrmA|nr:SAM-dependent methyltransferase [Bacteroidota bacterium]